MSLDGERADFHTTSPVRRITGQALAGMLAIAFPPVCAGCRVSGSWLCRRCAELMPLIDQSSVCHTCGSNDVERHGPVCSSCANWGGEVRALRSYALHDGVMREAIHRLKYEGESARAAWAGPLLAALAQDAGWDVDVIVPVPLHANRLRSRGYNQAEKLARSLSGALGVPVAARLMRVRDTHSQVGLDAAARQENVRRAFQASPLLANARVLLVDDVMTTGATIRACAAAIRDVDALDVVAVTLARATEFSAR